MSQLAEAIAALPEFRAELLRGNTDLTPQIVRPLESIQAASLARRANIHATGIGLRRGRSAQSEDIVLKVFVFESDPPREQYRWHDFDVETDTLPIQQKFATPPNRLRHRPVPGGVSTAPLGAGYVGTLGCFLRRQTNTGNELFALSNNHVFADVNRLPIGTQICQSGPEFGPSTPADVIASLHQFIPLSFAPGTVNDHDAAIARVTEEASAQLGVLLGIQSYLPGSVIAPKPGMTVTKSGRTTGVTVGTITSINVNGVQVNYADPGQPSMIGVFNNVIQIVGQLGASFSLPGDSGSLVVTSPNGEPVGLLFAGDTVNTFATPMASLCNRLSAWPV